MLSSAPCARRSSGSGSYAALGAGNMGLVSSSKGGAAAGTGVMTTGGKARSHGPSQSAHHTKSSEGLEMSETEVDRDNRRRINDNRRRHTSFSIAV